MPSTPIRVLYVDDDAALVRLVERTLGRRGFLVAHAVDAEVAMTKINAGGIDVIALDHNLSTGTGLDLLAQLPAIDDRPAIVYVTGSAEMDVAVAALKAGADDFVPKTVGENFLVLLAAALEQAVEKSKLRTARDEAEREVHLARDRAELMLREMNHRVANSLALVSSLVSLQANAVLDPAAKEALAETQARILAVSLVHRRLYTSNDVSVVDVAEYLGSLLGHLEGSLAAEGHGAHVTRQIAAVKVQPDVAINLGVIVTELLTNAFKYAYPKATGEIRVFATVNDDTMTLIVQDDGVGWSGKGPAHGTGLGSRIIKAMTASLEGELRYESFRGTKATLRFPLTGSRG